MGSAKSKAEELDERIEWVLKNRPHLVVRGEPSQREWSRLARHANGEPFGITQVNQMRLRIKSWVKDPKGSPEPSWEIETLSALADAAKVSRVWFAQGVGDPDVFTERTERYAEMPAVREMARVQGFDPAFISSWEADLDSDDQPDADRLWQLMKESWNRHTKKTRAQGDPLADLDDRPVRNARKKT